MTDLRRFRCALLCLLLAAAGARAAVTQTLDTRLGPLRLEGDLPALSALTDLFDELDFQQATQVYLWALPLVSFAQWRDSGTRCLVDNVMRRADLSSRMPLEHNADGSVDLHFGPRPPAGRERNWIQTVPGRHWFAWFRLHAPGAAWFDRSWKLGDIEPMSMPSRIAPERPFRS